jgi:hypothetical protein
MKNLNSMAEMAKENGLGELECSQFAGVIGGYQPVWVNPAIIAQPFNTYWESPTLGQEPSHGIPYAQV